MKKIFITAVGGDIGQSILKCLEEHYPDSRFYGSDMDPFAATREELKRFYVSPSPGDKGYEAFIAKVVEENSIDHIIPVSEKEIVWFSKNRDLFEQRGTKVLVNNERIVDTFADKLNAARFFAENDIRHPRTFDANEYSDELGHPYILKKRISCGGKGLIKVERQGEIDLSDGRFQNCIVQEYVSDDCPEYTVAVFSDGEKTSSISFKRKLGYGSLTKVAELVFIEELDKIAQKVAVLTGLKGAINLQFRESGGEYILLEINPRFSSTVYLRNRFGFEDVKWWIDILDKKDFLYIPKYESGIAVRRVSEVFFDMKPVK